MTSGSKDLHRIIPVVSGWVTMVTRKCLKEAGTINFKIWAKIMNRIDEALGLTYKDFEMPGSLVQKSVCTISGKLAGSGCPSQTEWLIRILSRPRHVPDMQASQLPQTVQKIRMTNPILIVQQVETPPVTLPALMGILPVVPAVDSGNTGGGTDSGNNSGNSGNTGGDSGNTGGDSGNTGGGTDSGNTGGSDSGNDSKNLSSN